MKNENEIMVLPLNKDKIILAIEAILPKEDNQRYDIPTGALCNTVMVVDMECCYCFLENRLVDGGISPVYDIPVRIITKTSSGSSIPMSPSFYMSVSIAKLIIDFTDAPISLKEFMGSRYSYNPRIERNMQEFLTDANVTLSL